MCESAGKDNWIYRIDKSFHSINRDNLHEYTIVQYIQYQYTIYGFIVAHTHFD